MKPGNQPAFPAPTQLTVEGGVVIASSPGMTLRDYFAGQALIALLTSTDPRSTRGLAKLCYEVADAMIAERQK